MLWLWLFISGLILVIVLLLIKIHLLRKSAKEIECSFAEKLITDSNNHTDSDWCLCIGRFSVLPLLLRQFQEAPAPSKAGKNGVGK